MARSIKPIQKSTGSSEKLGVAVRDPERIPRILGKLHEIWGYMPDLRLNQLCSNVAKRQEWGNNDLFYLEDDEFEAGLDVLLAELRQKVNEAFSR
jgi:hypothetical protein